MDDSVIAYKLAADAFDEAERQLRIYQGTIKDVLNALEAYESKDVYVVSEKPSPKVTDGWDGFELKHAKFIYRDPWPSIDQLEVAFNVVREKRKAAFDAWEKVPEEIKPLLKNGPPD